MAAVAQILPVDSGSLAEACQSAPDLKPIRTFVQIAFLVERYRRPQRIDWRHYGPFVTLTFPPDRWTDRAMERALDIRSPIGRDAELAAPSSATGARRSLDGRALDPAHITNHISA